MLLDPAFTTTIQNSIQRIISKDKGLDPGPSKRPFYRVKIYQYLLILVQMTQRNLENGSESLSQHHTSRRLPSKRLPHRTRIYQLVKPVQVSLNCCRQLPPSLCLSFKYPNLKANLTGWILSPPSTFPHLYRLHKIQTLISLWTIAQN